MKHRRRFIYVPQYNLPVHCAASEDDWLRRVECHFSNAVWHFNIRCGFLCIKSSPERVKDTNNWLVLAPAHMICLAISDCERRTIAVPAHACYLVIAVETTDLVTSRTRSLRTTFICSRSCCCRALRRFVIPVVKASIHSASGRGLRIRVFFKI